MGLTCSSQRNIKYMQNFKGEEFDVEENGSNAGMDLKKWKWLRFVDVGIGGVEH